MSKPIRAFWWPAKNFGDTLTPIIVPWVTGHPIVNTQRKEKGRLLAVGSIAHLAQPGDTIWGSGNNRTNHMIQCPIRVLATRGPLTRDSLIVGKAIPKIYGDPAILLPLIYNPKVEKTHDVGIVPHYVDKHLVEVENPRDKIIDIQADWQTVIREILSCERIISSSLHGIIAAEAYGISTIWAIWGHKIIGVPLKYHDYFLGTGRELKHCQPFKPLPPIQDLAPKQQGLINALKEVQDSLW